MHIKVGEFIFLFNIIILRIKPRNPRGHVILGRPFLTTFNTLINYHNSVMKLRFGNMTVNLNIFNL